MKELLQALSTLITEDQCPELSAEAKEEAQHQAVLSLIGMDATALAIISNNVKICREQQKLSEILSGFPYLILKGTAASVYYPVPIRRTLGDIDIIVTPDNYSGAKSVLIRAGYKQLKEDDRHTLLQKNGILVELHRRFAILQKKEQEEQLDSLIFDAARDPIIGQISTYTFPMADDELNGLILLTHINQHLEEGLGLRQLIDFIVFIKYYLTDEKWQSFKEKTDRLGLTTLAKVVGKLGQTYLGLDKRIVWCSDASSTTAEHLLEYTFECGNFGRKEGVNNTIVMIMSHSRGIKGFFKNLQKQGKKNWIALKKHSWLKPIAWIYQLGRYARLGLKNQNLKRFKRNMTLSHSRNKLMDELDVTRAALRK